VIFPRFPHSPHPLFYTPPLSPPNLSLFKNTLVVITELLGRFRLRGWGSCVLSEPSWGIPFPEHQREMTLDSPSLSPSRPMSFGLCRRVFARSSAMVCGLAGTLFGPRGFDLPFPPNRWKSYLLLEAWIDPTSYDTSSGSDFLLAKQAATFPVPV